MQSDSLSAFPSYSFAMVAAVVYTVVGDTVIIRMVWICGTSLTEFVVLRAIGRMSLVTEVPSSSIQLLVLCMAAYTFLGEKLPNFQSSILDSTKLRVNWYHFYTSHPQQ